MNHTFTPTILPLPNCPTRVSRNWLFLNHAGLLLGLGLLLLPVGAEEEAAPSPFSWRAGYAEGLAAALEARRPLLVYFPPIEAADEPRWIALAPRALGVPPMAEGARVGSADIADLVNRFEVKKVPALLLLDRRENVVLKWEEKFPREIWSAVEAAVRRIVKKDEEDAKVLRDGQSLEATGDLDGAYRKVAPLIGSTKTAPDTLSGARRIEARYGAEMRRTMLRVLGKEGLVPEAKLIRELETLAGTNAHAGARREIEREIARLRETAPGAGG